MSYTLRRGIIVPKNNSEKEVLSGMAGIWQAIGCNLGAQFSHRLSMQGWILEKLSSEH